MTHGARGYEEYEEPEDDGFFDDESEQPQRRKKRRGPLFVLFMVCILVLLIPVLLLSFYAGRGFLAINSIERDSSLTPTEYEGRPAPAAPKPDNPEGPAPINFVLMGSDARGSERGRSDSLMVAHITGDRKHVYLISFPRDMWVEVPGRGKAKINAAYSWGGPALTVRTLENLLDVRMDHTVGIDFEGFINLTQAVGGVTVHNPWASSSNGYSFKEGELTLQGEEALVYVRERYNLPNGDLDRAYRQRTVVKGIIRQLATPETLTNPARFNDVVGQVADTLAVDDQMTNSYITELGMSMRITGTDGVRMLQAPITGFATIQGQSVDVVDFGRIKMLSDSLKSDTMDFYFESYGKDNYAKLPQVDPPE
ncbi:MAG: LCP family protein [Propionibacteriaceae bacterium]|nr:LCP family protein [Propionibacteriaceae bacterium]